MPRTLAWILYAAYAIAGALALMMATSAGVSLLGQVPEALSFLPARITGLPWSAITFFYRDGPVTDLALLGISYALNLAVGLMLTVQMGGEARRPTASRKPDA